LARRAEFGRSSEKLARKSALTIGTVETDQVEGLAAAAPEAVAILERAAEAQKPARRPLPDHLRRKEVMPTPEDLPDDITALKRIIAEMARDVATARTEIARLKARAELSHTAEPRFGSTVG
jgi:hypothetical protein